MDKHAVLRQVAIKSCFDFVFDYIYLSNRNWDEYENTSTLDYLIYQEFYRCLDDNIQYGVGIAKSRCSCKRDAEYIQKVIDRGFLKNLRRKE